MRSSVVHSPWQPPSRAGRGHVGGGASRHTGVGGPSGSSFGNGSGGRSPVHSNSRPLRDLSLRGLRVTSTAAAVNADPASPPPSSSSLSPPPRPSSLSLSEGEEPSPACCNNGRLGLVVAASQRQGKRPSQEDRAMVAPDLVAALAGKVS